MMKLGAHVNFMWDYRLWLQAQFLIYEWLNERFPWWFSSNILRLKCRSEDPLAHLAPDRAIPITFIRVRTGRHGASINAFLHKGAAIAHLGLNFETWCLYLYDRFKGFPANRHDTLPCIADITGYGSAQRSSREGRCVLLDELLLLGIYFLI